MKKKNIILSQSEQTAQPTANVNNYKPDIYAMFLSELYYDNSMPRTPDAPAIMKAQGIPYELAVLLEKKIKSVMASQSRYDILINYLLNPSV